MAKTNLMIKAVVLCGTPTNETADATTGPHGSVETKYSIADTIF